VRGWVKVYSYTDPREAILEHDRWLLGRDGSRRSVRVDEGKRHGKSVLARLEGIDDREAAEALLGLDIAVDRDSLREPETGHYYWADLAGLTVWHKEERELGVVTQMLETGAHDVMVVKGDTERLIPFVPGEVVLDVDLDERRVRVDWEWD
jgi:16S rRNA processing protein RimM